MQRKNRILSTALSIALGVAISPTPARAMNACEHIFEDPSAPAARAERLAKFKATERYLNSKIIGQPQLVEELMVALLVRGHVLLQGHPGAGKTLIARELAKSVTGESSRIQFTPDLMPGDITGSEQMNQKTGEREFHRGPLFGNIVLADEINRASPKTQSALLQAMEERAVTVGRTTHEMDGTYLVIATQNPHDGRGTFELPEAQLDRFLFKIELDYPAFDDEKEIFRQNIHGQSGHSSGSVHLETLTEQSLDEARKEIRQIKIDDKVEHLILTLVRATRGLVPELTKISRSFKTGAGPRATIQLGKAAQARAYLQGRHAVNVDDIRAMAPDILSHRTSLSDQASISGDADPRMLIEEMINRIDGKHP